jgi:type I restriction-modification system DNA methylase subunit
MSNNKLYSCGICNSKPDQISHHKSHIDTQKHKDKKELFELKLSKLNEDELFQKHNSTNVKHIVEINETIVQEPLKKLNNNDNNNIVIDDPNMVTLIKDMEEQIIVSNKEALRDKIHEIHNYLRNNGAGYGMNALKVFNILYGLKKIEENKLFDKINLKRPDCEFSHLLGLANKNKDEKLAELIYGSVLDSIHGSNIKDLLFYEIPKNMKSSTFNYLIKEIDKITLIEKKCNVLLSGKIYEYFIGRDESAISELGAYFTDRHIVDYIYDKLKPKLNKDNTIKSMVDMFGGSGGFTTGYINHLVKSYPKLIKWSNEINKIYHYDMNEDVIKSAGLEFFCLTGEIPNMKENLFYKNSFTDEFGDKKYDLVITNPPYGGDKNKQSDTQIKRDKVKEYIKEELKTLKDKEKIKQRMLQLKVIENSEKQEKKENDKKKVSVEMSSARIQKFAKDNKLSGNDKESVSLMLMMDMLNIDGTCIGVLKEGVFFNRTYKDLRKCLINNFNVREVISIPQDQFENTSTKTSIVIFDNTKEKTKEIKFYGLEVAKYEKDEFKEIDNNIILTENKGDIYGVHDKLISVATLDELNKNTIYSLNGKDYNKKL